jgi:iron complex transport system permease protein
VTAASAPSRRQPRLWLWLSVAALFVVVAVSFGAGKFAVPPLAALAALVEKLTGRTDLVSADVRLVIWQVRAPRVLAAVLVGASLSGAGATYQGLFRNPLVSPDILGVAAGAGLGAITGIYLDLPIAAIQALAFAGGLVAVAIVYLVGVSIRSRDPVLALVLAGVAVGTLLGAATSMLKIFADPYNQLPAMTYWLLGSLTSVTLSDLASATPAIAIGLLPLVLLRWRMNVMSLGDEEARALGVESTTLRAIFISAATLMTAAAVSIAGVVGWVGLIIPHAARLLVGPDYSRLLPLSLVLGAGFLVFADTLARVIAVTEIPLGIVTAVVGAPVFLWLLGTGRRGW